MVLFCIRFLFRRLIFWGTVLFILFLLRGKAHALEQSHVKVNSLQDAVVIDNGISIQADFIFDHLVEEPSIAVHESGMLTIMFPRASIGTVDMQVFFDSLYASGLIEKASLRAQRKPGEGFEITLHFKPGKGVVRRQCVYRSGANKVTFEAYRKDRLIKLRYVIDGPLLLT